MGLPEVVVETAGRLITQAFLGQVRTMLVAGVEVVKPNAARFLVAQVKAGSTDRTAQTQLQILVPVAEVAATHSRAVVATAGLA